MRTIMHTIGVACLMLISVVGFSQATASNESFSNGTGNGIEYMDGNTYNVRVYPNPSTEFVNVNSYDLVGKSFFIMDLTGKAVAAKQTMEDNLITLNVSNYPSGVYFMRFEDGTLIKFIVKK